MIRASHLPGPPHGAGPGGEHCPRLCRSQESVGLTGLRTPRSPWGQMGVEAELDDARVRWNQGLGSRAWALRTRKQCEGEGDPRIKHQSKVGTIGTSWDEEWGSWHPHSHVPGPIGTTGFFLSRRARAWKTQLSERTRHAQPAFDGLTLLHPALPRRCGYLLPGIFWLSLAPQPPWIPKSSRVGSTKCPGPPVVRTRHSRHPRPRRQP